MDSSLSEELTYEDFALEMLKEIVDTMNTIGTQVLRGIVADF